MKILKQLENGFPMKTTLLIFSGFLILSTIPDTSAKTLNGLQKTWETFLAECELVVSETPQVYAKGGVGGNGKIESAASKDKKSIAINKVISNGYIEVFSYSLSDRDYISCAAYLEHNGSINSAPLADEFVVWINDLQGVNIFGGNASLYRPREFNFGIEGAWGDRDLTTRVRLSDTESQFFVTFIEK